MNVPNYNTIIVINSFHLQSLEEQFPREEGYKISRCKDFRFKETISTESQQASIKLTVPSQHDQCIIALEPANGKVCRCLYIVILTEVQCDLTDL